MATHIPRPRRARLFSAVVLLVAAGLWSPPATAADPAAPATRPAAVFRAGAATSNITPALGEPIVGGFAEPKAERVHDELHARCLVLDDGTTRLALVVCDSVGIPRDVLDEAKRQIHEAAGIPPARVLISATHTHSATSARNRNPLVPDKTFTEYQSFVARRIADGVRRAIGHLEPAQVGWGAADEPRPLFNRRYRMRPGTELLNPLGGTDQVKMNPGVGNPDVVEPVGPTDPQVSFLTVRSTGGRPIALLANYSLHYVGGVPVGEVSADYFAVFADKIRDRLGRADRAYPPFVGILCNGTSGDVNNIDVMGPRLAARSAATQPATTRPAAARQAPYEQIDKVATMVADTVAKAHESVRYHDHVPLRSAVRELTLATRRPTPELVARAKRILAGEQKPRVPNEEAYARRTLQLAESPDAVSVPLQALRIGDLGIAAIPFEVFTETGLEIKARSTFRPSTFTVSLANGSFGYLPTPAQHRLGGYETWLGTNWAEAEVEASTRIVDALLEMLAEVKAGK